MNTLDGITLRPPTGPIDRTVCLPGSKSITNRALLLAAMAHGTSHLDGVLIADDTRLMSNALDVLGVAAMLDEETRRANIKGCGGFWPNSEGAIFCGNAGTVMRFVTAACCIGHGDYRLDGVERMRERPIGELVEALHDLGASIAYEGKTGCCPLNVAARGLRGGVVRFSHAPSSQFLSAILMAAPRAANDVMIEIAGPMPSMPYVRMTLGVMEAFGVSAVEYGMRKFIVPGMQTYSAANYAVEPDASTASYFFAAAAITGGRITVDGLGSESIQGDIGFTDILEQMGCRVERKPKSTTVRGPGDRRLSGIDVDLNHMPDVAQTLGVLAAFADGPTRIRNVANLRVKETDRLHALSTELGRLGVHTEVHKDGITVRPKGLPSPGVIETYYDHRMAMSFALAGLRLEGMVVRNPRCVSKTFPEFFQLWNELG
ncbi:MAG: 3-phosphoshikimate 1-carboxyvinyltransferase [Planctomycetota bacterium]